MFADYKPEHLNGRVNLISQPDTKSLFSMYDQNKRNKTSFRDALKGSKEESPLSSAFFSKENVQIVQNGLRAGVYEMSDSKFVIGLQSYDSIKIIMQDVYFDFAKNDGTPISQQVNKLNQEIFKKYVPKLHGEAIGYLNYKRDVSTVRDPIMYPKQSGDRDFKNLEYKRW